MHELRPAYLHSALCDEGSRQTPAHHRPQGNAVPHVLCALASGAAAPSQAVLHITSDPRDGPWSVRAHRTTVRRVRRDRATGRSDTRWPYPAGGPGRDQRPD